MTYGGQEQPMEIDRIKKKDSSEGEVFPVPQERALVEELPAQEGGGTCSGHARRGIGQGH